MDLLQGTLAVLQSIVNRSQNISEARDRFMGALNIEDPESYPRSDLDHFINAERLNQVAQETIPEEEGEDDTALEGACIVDDDLEVNNSKQQQLNQSLLSSSQHGQPSSQHSSASLKLDKKGSHLREKKNECEAVNL